MPNTIIIGSGCYVPERVIGRDYFLNSEFYTEDGEKLDKPNAEIIQKFVEITEIENRRYINEDWYNSDMATVASQRAIQDAGIDQESLDYIIFASNFGEVNETGVTNFMPNMAARLKNKLGIKNRKCITYDMIFGCPGWVEALILADIFIKSGNAKNILVVGAETLSRVTDPYDKKQNDFCRWIWCCSSYSNQSRKCGNY